MAGADTSHTTRRRSRFVLHTRTLTASLAGARTRTIMQSQLSPWRQQYVQPRGDAPRTQPPRGKSLPRSDPQAFPLALPGFDARNHRRGAGEGVLRLVRQASGIDRFTGVATHRLAPLSPGSGRPQSTVTLRAGSRESQGECRIGLAIREGRQDIAR